MYFLCWRDRVAQVVQKQIVFFCRDFLFLSYIVLSRMGLSLIVAIATAAH
jgi:hypothetical protein